MSKHRAPRNRIHFLIAGCTLALASILVLLSSLGVLSANPSSTIASVVTPDTPYISSLKVAPSIPTSPDTPPKPTAADIREAQLEEALREQQAAVQKAAQEKAAADAAAAKAAQEKAAAAAAKAAADKAAADAAAAAAAKAKAAAPPPVAKPAPSTSRAMNASAYQAYAAGKVDSTQYGCLVKMWNNESGWNPNAQNPSSTAYGIPQFLDSTWATVGYSKTSDPYTQIDAGLAYISKAYSTPCGAWSFWQANHYY